MIFMVISVDFGDFGQSCYRNPWSRGGHIYFLAWEEGGGGGGGRGQDSVLIKISTSGLPKDPLTHTFSVSILDNPSYRLLTQVTSSSYSSVAA